MSKSRMDMRVGAFDRYTLSICGKNTELVCRTSNFCLLGHESEEILKFSRIAGGLKGKLCFFL